MNGAIVPGTYCWGTYTATRRVYGAGWLVRHVELCGIGRIGRAERPLLPHDAGIDLAVGGLHREDRDRPVRHTLFHHRFRRGLCVGPMMKFPSSSAAGTRAVRQFLRVHVTRCVRIPGGGVRDARRGARGLSARQWPRALERPVPAPAATVTPRHAAEDYRRMQRALAMITLLR